ncbi:MAG: hypothetical protein AMJ61_03120 [Desulfobacterales bacterium SG8_35_2]|nr:MAG: hypothetical protein AMJ61_03120 [Desulfobacterales bacterium SG8_35_2]
MGGLSKKAYQLEKIRGLHELPGLTLDGGNLLFKQQRLSPGLLQQAKITAAGIIDSYNSMKYDAVAVGKNDLAAGLSFLQNQSARSEFPWLSVNLVRKSDQGPLFSAALIRRMGNISVGVIGLTAHDGSIQFGENEDAELLPWQEVLPDIVTDLTEKCDLLILLSNNVSNENEKIAEALPDIHMIIQSSPRSGNIAPKLTNKSLIVQTGKQGKYLGWMLINWQKSKTWGHTGAAKELATKKRELDGISGRISRIERHERKQDLPANANYQKLLAARETLFSEIIFLENELHDLKESGLTFSTFENHFIPLEVNLPDQPDVKKIVETTKLSVNQAGRNQAEESAISSAMPELQLEKLPFTGWETCAPCHSAQTSFWRKTGHASAYQTLASEEQQFNLDCLPCHVTGEYKDIRISNNDTVLLSLPAQLQQVGCEVCHGPGRNHAATRDTNAIFRKPDISICTRCHTAERDENFKYDNDIELIACPASK